LVIRAPKQGAHIGQTLNVRVAVLGTAPAGPQSFKYVLDGRFTRHGGERVTFTDLTPGRHHIVVTLVGDAGVTAGRGFTVKAPPPPPSPPPPTTTTSTVQPTTTTAPAPMPNTSTAAPTPAPAPAPAPSPPPAASGGIPQGNSGDMDADNNGGPSDGDGNI
jgi:hypothetical protein